MFCLAQRQAGVFAFVGAPSLGTVTVTSVAGTEDSGDTIITVKGSPYILENGMIADGYELVVTSGQNAAVSNTYGSAPNAGETWAVKGSGQFVLKSQTASKYATVAIVNKESGYCVAGGNAVIVVKA